MKVLVLDCINSEESPETKVALDRLVEAIKSAGSEVKIIPVYDLEIKPCFSCTAQYSYQYSDKCRCDDDMNNLYPDFRNSDTWVFAAHVNSNGSTKYLKNLLDRMEPLFQPEIASQLESELPSIEDEMNGKMMIISSYDYESAEQARVISDYIDSISLLFAKHAPGNILLDKSRIDGNKLQMIYSYGLELVSK